MQHPGVVDHEQITRPELVLQIPHPEVAGMGHGPCADGINDQQPGIVTGLHRPLSDEFTRQAIAVAR